MEKLKKINIKTWRKKKKHGNMKKKKVEPSSLPQERWMGVHIGNDGRLTIPLPSLVYAGKSEANVQHKPVARASGLIRVRVKVY